MNLDIFNVRNLSMAVVTALLPMLGTCLSGCSTTWQATNGKAVMTWRPGIVFRTDTSILFNAGPDPLLRVETEFAAEGETDETDEGT